MGSGLSSHVPPRGPKVFVNRVEELALLERWAFSQAREPMILSGVAGIGKTALAAIFAERLADRGWSVIWSSGQHDEASNYFDIDGEFVSALSALRTSRNHGLLVLDGEYDVKRIRTVVAIAEINLFKVLVTTRDGKLGTLGRRLEISRLTLEDSVSLLLESRLEITRAEAMRLAERLQGLPLSLEIASKVLRESHSKVSVDQMLAVLDHRDVEDSEAQSRERINRHTASIARRDYEEALGFLAAREYDNAVVNLTRSAAALQTALGPSNKDTMEAKLALADALQGAQHLGEALVLLKEVAATAETAFGPSAHITLRARSNTAALLKKMGKSNEALNILRWLIPHLEQTLGPDHPDTLEGNADLAGVLSDLGHYEDAVQVLLDVIARSRELPGPKFANFALTAEGNLAVILAEIGRLDDASALLDRVNNQLFTLTGPTQAALAAESQLARVLWQSGDSRGAIILERRALDGRLRLLGSNHPDTLRSRNSLAQWLGDIGDVGPAIAELEQLVNDSIEALGQSHPETLEARNNLAYWKAESGAIESAIKDFETLLADQSRILGAEHPDTLVTRANLAYWYGDIGRVTFAIEQFRLLCEDSARILGSEHPDTLRTRANLAH